jgi:hypothetical protein
MSEQPDFDFDGDTYEPVFDKPRLNTLLGKVWNVMQDERWRTLAEIHVAIGGSGSEASISARLRDFRKPRFSGAYEVDRRRRGNAHHGLFEYRLCGGSQKLPAA